ncbi:MAG: DNA polymerase III subunit chi [Magnetococcales bacterium]|nr:DNA polymerase III subunit chi [Magnetococcales bacterium]
MSRRDEADLPPLVRFYQVAGEVESFLARVVSKAYEKGLKVCVVARSEEQARELDQFLWRYPGGDAFLPHELCGGPRAARQPVLVCAEAVDINGATVAVMAGGQLLAEPHRFDRVIDFTLSDDQQALAASRERFRRYREMGCRMEYIRQEPGGGWSQQE